MPKGILELLSNSLRFIIYLFIMYLPVRYARLRNCATAQLRNCAGCAHAVPYIRFIELSLSCGCFNNSLFIYFEMCFPPLGASFIVEFFSRRMGENAKSQSMLSENPY